jgi:alanine dehydrogenase
MSSVIARTATNAFFNTAIHYIIEIASKGIEQAMQEHPAIANAIITHKGALHNLKRLSPKEA